MRSAEREWRLQRWAAFINGELASRRLRPGQFAAYTNVSTSSVSLWQRGRALPSGEAVVRVAQYLRVPLEVVAARAGMVTVTPPRVSRADTDPEWQALLLELEALPAEQLREVAQALRVVLRTAARRRAG
jgi:transcriptional regulator with XRE-family HTH domain